MPDQLFYDVTVSALAETATGSGIFKVTALPTAGVDAERPPDTQIDDTNGIQIYFTGSPPRIAVGTRMWVGIDAPVT